jgi:L-fuconolactonase
MSDQGEQQRTWLQQVQEEIIDPGRRIVDPHHHLWRHPGMPAYLLEDLWDDTRSGHRVEKTVFMECSAEYRSEGPEHLRSLGEVDFVRGLAERSRSGGQGEAEIAALISHIDLSRGDAVAEDVAAHVEAAGGLFRGVRDALARDENTDVLMIPGHARKDLYADPDFHRGIQVLGQLGHTYDSWHYHHQLPDYLTLARAVPDTLMVLDHFGTPLGVGPYADKREAIFEQWKQDVAEIARCENVVAKLGGLAMPDNGFGWFGRDTPPTSDEFVAAQSRYYLHMIDCFGPNRCMFESNFPVDKLSISYPVLWNGLKKIVADFSEDEKDAMFSGTATRVYRL